MAQQRQEPRLGLFGSTSKQPPGVREHVDHLDVVSVEQSSLWL